MSESQLFPSVLRALRAAPTACAASLERAARGGLALALLAALVAAAEEERHPELGLALEPPPRYSAIPVQPDEAWIVLRYVRESDSRSRAAFESELFVVRIARGEDPSPLPDPPPITTFERYLDQRWQAFEVGSDREGSRRDGWVVRELELRLSPLVASRFESALADVVFGWAETRSDARNTWVLLGFCAAGEAEKELRAWRKCAASLAISEPVPHPDSERWAQHYARNPKFRNPELRIRLRSRLVGDWEARDTENYLLVYETKKESLVTHLAKRLEGIRREYAVRFPPVREITAVSTVRLCEDQADYHRYGGPTGSAGYWNRATEELVLFVFENDEGDWQSGKENSRSVLYHEAFHQFVYYAVGDLDPHSWFNEGYGDYFAGARFDVHGKVGGIDVNAWRVGTIKQAIASGLAPSWNVMGWMTKPEYYGLQRGINYAMGWSMVYFLEESAKARRHPVWKQILPVYFETLKQANARRQDELAAAELTHDEKALEELRGSIRDEAASAAFRDVDLDELTEAWRKFTLELRPPK